MHKMTDKFKLLMGQKFINRVKKKNSTLSHLLTASALQYYCIIYIKH